MASRGLAPASFSATLTARHAGFLSVLDLVSGSFDDTVCLEVTPAGISVTSVDKAQSSYLDAYFPSRGSCSIFKNYICRREHLSLFLHPKHLAKVLKSVAGPSKLLSSIQLLVGEAEDRLVLKTSALTKLGLGQNASYNLALLHADTGFEKVTVDGSDFVFSAEAMTDVPALFVDLISQLKAAGCQEVELCISEERMVLASRGPDLVAECEIALEQHQEGGKLCLVADAPCTAKYAFKFFERISKVAAASSRLLLQMGAEAPLSIIADLAAGGALHIFIAPLVEEEEDS